MCEWTTALSRCPWQATQVRTPRCASRRRAGIASPQSSQCSRPSPAGIRIRAPCTASLTVSSICSCTAPSRAHPPAISVSLRFRPQTWERGTQGSILARHYGGRLSLQSKMSDWQLSWNCGKRANGSNVGDFADELLTHQVFAFCGTVKAPADTTQVLTPTPFPLDCNGIARKH